VQHCYQKGTYDSYHVGRGAALALIGGESQRLLQGAAASSIRHTLTVEKARLPITALNAAIQSGGP
jgi:hypothetical protein